MKVLAASVLFLCMASPAFAEPIFSFNTVNAEDFVRFSKKEGIRISDELAEALVATREKSGAFKTVEDLKKVPGMNQLILQQLFPIEENGDVLFDPENAPVMKGY